MLYMSSEKNPIEPLDLACRRPASIFNKKKLYQAVGPRESQRDPSNYKRYEHGIYDIIYPKLIRIKLATCSVPRAPIPRSHAVEDSLFMMIYQIILVLHCLTFYSYFNFQFL